MVSCKKEVKTDTSELIQKESVTLQRKCAADDVLQAQLNEDPTLKRRMDEIENFIKQYVENVNAGRLLPDGTIEIPVVVNVVYNTTAENVSDAQIASQIAVLNQDFSATNPDYNNTPAAFESLRSGNIGVTFVLDQVKRRYSTVTSWSTIDNVKRNNRGGISPTSPTTKLNIWVCDLGSGILGYAQFPGGNANTDGVVIDYQAFGTTGSAVAPFNKGRTATHEVGHWLNLRHIWGDDGSACKGSDLVSDTPNQGGPNYGCRLFPEFPAQMVQTAICL
ncbi:MAG: M43 family zinc metalloprotease [Chitinophagaceae bacterium]|nr:M43 family zinc metalloprotease [Chitinophagaceae bacterium]